MSRPPRSHKTQELAKTLQHRLNAYALAASAAGVGSLTLLPSAEAKVIYTPAHKLVMWTLNLDLNHDKIVDFTITPVIYNGFQYLGALSLKSNRVFGDSVRPRYRAAELPAGFRVGPNAIRFQIGATRFSFGQPFKDFFFCDYTSSYYGHCTGPWTRFANGYLGLKFSVAGKTHYGWARFVYISKVADKHMFHTQWFLTGYAYETVPDKPIVTGQTKSSAATASSDPNTQEAHVGHSASLGMLAAGSSGLSVWRHKSPVVSTIGK
jgi:hypothetical protein